MGNREKMAKLRERCIVLVIISATEQGLLLLYSFDTLPSPKPNVLNPHSLLQGLTANNLSLSLSLSITHGRHFLNPQVLPHTHNFHFPTKPHNSTPPPLSSSFLPKTLTPFHLKKNSHLLFPPPTDPIKLHTHTFPPPPPQLHPQPHLGHQLRPYL